MLHYKFILSLAKNYIEYLNDEQIKEKNNDKATKIFLQERRGILRLYQSQKIKQLMTSTPFSIFMSALTIYTIFAIDIDKGFFNNNASTFFSCMHVASMVVFVLQIILMSKTEKDYVFQFYFWIDVFSTLTMILQLIWIEDLMSSIQNIQVAISFARVSKASRFSKIGARSTKIMKLIRLIKLMKLMRKQSDEQQIAKNNQQQIYPDENQNQNMEKIIEKQSTEENKQKQFVSFGTQKNSQALKDQIIGQSKLKSKAIKIVRQNVNQEQQKEIQQKWQILNQNLANKNNPAPEEQQKGTKVGEILKYEIQKNIVIMVMALIIIVPILGADTWFTKTVQLEFATQFYLDAVKKSNENLTQSFTAAWLNSFLQLSIEASSPAVYFQLYSLPYEDRVASSNIVPVQDLRQSEKTVLKDEADAYKIIYSKKKQVQITSWINMSRSVFITLVLVFASIFFVKDLESYALLPLQKMNNTVQKIQKNLLSSIQICGQQEDEQQLLEENKQNDELELQTNVLSNLLIKIAGLLALGVGQTPSCMTANGMDETSNNQDLLQDEASILIEGVFMVMHVAHVDKIIQILEGQAAQYINSFMKLFHETVIQNGGCIYHQDDSYTTVCWKIDPLMNGPSQKVMQIKIQEKKKIQLAFHAYFKFCERVNQDPLTKKYQYLNSFVSDLESIKFHVGIHSGAALCGAIGSSFKISLRALGTDPSIARALCRAAQKYKLSNCISSTIYKQAPFIHGLCRNIDQVAFVELSKQHQQSQIYSVYFHQECSKNATISQRVKQVKQINQCQFRRKMNKLFKNREDILCNGSKHKTQEFAAMTKSLFKKHPNVQQWLQNWRQTQDHYELGKWDLAEAGFTNIKEFYTQFVDFLLEIRQKQVAQTQQPPPLWKKHKDFSLFL